MGLLTVCPSSQCDQARRESGLWNYSNEGSYSFLRQKMEYPEHELLSSEQQDPNDIENQSHNK